MSKLCYRKRRLWAPGSRRIGAVYAAGRGPSVSGAEAIRFAMFESGRGVQAVILVPDVVELDMTRDAEAPEQQTQCHAP